VKLPEQDPELFKFFVHWLYTSILQGYFYPNTFKPTLHKLREELSKEVLNLKKDSQLQLPSDNLPRQLYNKAHYYDVPFSTLIALYILADILQVHNLKDPIINTLVENYDFYCKKWSQGDDSPWGPDLEELICLFWSREVMKMGLESPTIGINLA